jgi:hypothetical protein
MRDEKKSETSDQRLWRNTRFLKAVGIAAVLGMAGMGGGVEARSQAPGLALPLEGHNNTTALPPALEGFNNLSNRTALEFNPSKMTQADRDYLRKLGMTDQDIRNVQQGKYDGQTSSEQKESSKNKGKNPLSSNREKVDVLRSLMVRAETDPRARQRLRQMLAKSRQLERANRTRERSLGESTTPSPSSLTHVVGPTHECIVSDPSECLDITGTKVTAWAQPSSLGIRGEELRVDMDLQVTNRCPDTVKDVTFVVDAKPNCPPGHVYEPHYNAVASLTFTYPANPTVIDVGAIASAQNSTLVQCVNWPGTAYYESAALPDSFNLDIHAQGSDTQLTVRSQDKYVAAVGPMPDHCPQTPPAPDAPANPQTPPAPDAPANPQTPPTPEAPATDTPSHRHKGPNVGAVVGGVLGTIGGIGAVAGCSFKIRREKHDQVKGQVEVTEIGGSLKVG